jgi:anti-anti-sigma regulatory factor
MPFELTDDSSADVHELHAALVAHVQNELEALAHLELNASAVTRVSTASLQVLVGAIRAAEQRGIPTRWQHVSPALRDAAALLGLTAALRIDSRAAEDAG